AFCREYRIIADDIHAESFGTFDNLAADTTHANDAKHLVAKLYAEERLAVPFAGNCLLVGLRNVASNSHHHRESMLASRNRVAVRRVDDYDPEDRKSTCLNSSHVKISYAVFCLIKKNNYHYSKTKVI